MPVRANATHAVNTLDYARDEMDVSNAVCAGSMDPEAREPEAQFGSRIVKRNAVPWTMATVRSSWCRGKISMTAACSLASASRVVRVTMCEMMVSPGDELNTWPHRPRGSGNCTHWPPLPSSRALYRTPVRPTADDK